MTWTYSLATLATNQKDQVRLAIGDTGVTDPGTGFLQQLVQDEEINFFLSIRSSIFGAAAECCRSLATRYASFANRQAGDTKITFQGVARAFLQRAQEFDARASMTCLPYAGGISDMDKDLNEDDTDRVTPQFALGMFDSNLPVGQIPSGGRSGLTDENS